VHRKNVLIYIQQDATLNSLFYLETALHLSGGTTTHHQERKQLYLQHLVFVTPLPLPAAIAEEMSVAYATHSRLNPVPTLLFSTVLLLLPTAVTTEQGWRTQTSQHHTVTRGCMCSGRRLLMMDTVVSETCRAT
jgi:hypothetical protein